MSHVKLRQRNDRLCTPIGFSGTEGTTVVSVGPFARRARGALPGRYRARYASTDLWVDSVCATRILIERPPFCDHYLILLCGARVLRSCCCGSDPPLENCAFFLSAPQFGG